jgi:glutamate-1-semialdehyde 2,1-aminomutase
VSVHRTVPQRKERIEALKETIRQRTPRSGELFQRALKVYPAGEVSAARGFDPYPFYTARAEGAHIWDVDGNHYIDCCMCYGVHLLGHRPAVVTEALRAQLERHTHWGAPHPEEVEFAEKFTQCVPCAEMCILCNTGNEAVQKAVSLARAYSGRDRVAKFEGGFHGSNEYSLWSVGLDPATMGPAECPNAVAQAAGMPAGAGESILILPFGHDGAFRLIEEHAHELAVVMTEPVLGSGNLPHDREFLHKLRQVTRDNDVLLLFDEIITGFRLALGGGQERFGVVPDIGLFGKALAGATAIGAIGCREELVEKALSLDPPLSVAGTFSGNAMTIAAANAMLDYLMDNPQIYDDLEEKGDFLRDGFNEFAQAKGLPATMTGVGSMFQTVLAEPPVTKPRDLIREDAEAVEEFALRLRLKGVFIPAPLHLALLSPAHSEQDVKKILRAHQEALLACFMD